jgi:hypothetical protein
MTHAEDETNSALDRALEMTFPASDPIAVYIPEKRRMEAEPRTPAACNHGARTATSRDVAPAEM